MKGKCTDASEQTHFSQAVSRRSRFLQTSLSTLIGNRLLGQPSLCFSWTKLLFLKSLAGTYHGFRMWKGKIDAEFAGLSSSREAFVGTALLAYIYVNCPRVATISINPNHFPRQLYMTLSRTYTFHCADSAKKISSSVCMLCKVYLSVTTYHVG